MQKVYKKTQIKKTIIKVQTTINFIQSIPRKTRHNKIMVNPHIQTCKPHGSYNLK